MAKSADLLPMTFYIIKRKSHKVHSQVEYFGMDFWVQMSPVLTALNLCTGFNCGLIFFRAAYMVLCFRSATKTVLITQRVLDAAEQS